MVDRRYRKRVRFKRRAGLSFMYAPQAALGLKYVTDQSSEFRIPNSRNLVSDLLK